MSVVIATMHSQIVAPTALPFTVQWARDHLKAITASEDDLIESWIHAGTQWFEELTGRQVMEATWEYWLDAFPSHRRIELPHPPLRTVLAVEYVGDADGSVLSFGDGLSPETVHWQSRAPVGPHASRGWVELKYGLTWPTPRVESGAVRIRYTAGYAETTADVPELVKAAILRLVSDFDQYRGETHLSERSASLDQLPFGTQQIMRGFAYTAMPSQSLRTGTPWV